jgi:hypothetical protein
MKQARIFGLAALDAALTVAIEMVKTSDGIFLTVVTKFCAVGRSQVCNEHWQTGV